MQKGKIAMNIKMQKINDFGKPNYWLSVMTLDERSDINPIDIIDALEKENIEARHIWKPMHIQPYYEKFDFFNHYDSEESEIKKENQRKKSASEKIFNRGVCLPSDTKMTREEQTEVIKLIRQMFSRQKESEI